MEERPVAEAPGGAVVAVWVVPGASSTEIVGIHGDALKVRVAAPPEGGRANKALEIHLSDLLGTDVHVEKGTRSRRKVLFVANQDVSVVRRKLRLAE